MAPLKGGAGRAGRAVLHGVDAVLRTYASLLFSRSRATGALVFAATAVDPRALLLGLLAVIAAAVTGRGIGLPPGALADRPYGYNALLVGLGVAHGFELDSSAASLALGGGAIAVLVTAALTSLAAKVGDPPLLSVPFLLVTWFAMGVAPLLGLAPAAAVAVTPGGPLEAALAALGSLVFLPRVEAGALVLAALLVHSRIATLLAGTGIGLVLLVGQVAPAAVFAPMEQPLALNAFLTAIAIGGVWYVPSAPSFALATFGAVVSIAMTASIARPFAALGIAPLILPFNASVLIVLFAARQRARDQAPRSVDFAPGSPEENLAYVQTRRARFRSLYGVELRLPFRGAWICTQGVDGALTHRGEWRHAFDFEVADAQGGRFLGEGTRADDHHCHRLPVLAAADGTVAKVESDVPDNPIGGLELKRNWGNAVVVQHAPGLYSVVAHLAQGSARVVEGQVVRRGDVLGLCGNSGRSPAPHLHFQLQGTPQLGAPTLPCRFSDVVVVSGANEIVAPATTPREGETLRNLEADEGLASFLDPGAGTTLAFRVEGLTETLDSEVDLLGRRVLRSRELGAALFFGRTEDTFTLYDALGSPRSAVQLIRKALGRVAFDRSESLCWSDYLPARTTGSPLLRPFRDFASPFLRTSGLEMHYRARREGDWLEVTGRSRRLRSGGEPAVRTRAWLSRTLGIVAVEVHARGRARRAARVGDDGGEIACPRASREERGAAEVGGAAGATSPAPLPRRSGPMLEPLGSQPGES